MIQYILLNSTLSNWRLIPHITKMIDVYSNKYTEFVIEQDYPNKWLELIINAFTSSKSSVFQSNADFSHLLKFIESKINWEFFYLV